MSQGEPRAEISVQVASGAGELPDERFLCDWVERTLAVLPQERGVREIGLRLVDEDEGRALNQQYRQRDYATNVLSFPAAEDDEFAALDDALALPLGDLVLCAPVVIREALASNKTAAAHWAHLVVHGTLHLAGYDHEDAGDASVMEALEVRILAAGGIGDPYRERDSA